MNNRSRVAILAATIGLALLFLAIYLYLSSRHQLDKLRNENSEYKDTLKQTIEMELKDEVYITDQERLQGVDWNDIFDKYGVAGSTQNIAYLRIPNDNEQILSLLPANAKPVLFESSESASQVTYDIGNKRYDLIIYKSHDRIVKTIYLLLEQPKYLIGYRNINNQEYMPVITDLYP